MISLKAYNREIEQLIDNGLYDEAIAHCIHILGSYPKCIDSYRNLGKSLLELKKYPEALDVFSRVLSAIPDDFIAHVGLSLIFEDQNNLDLSIWHMEQAFDVQPSNLAIQDELKRLFGRRDGEQPTKIRLSRGALVRMYARGELFQQAITEIHSILEEDPRRIDLEVILARMHYLSGASDESAAVCNQIIEKIPYCFEANRILQQIHIDNKDNESAAVNKNRLISLDPYYQFISSPFSDQEVPEEKVTLEKLVYVPSKTSSAQIPAWLEEIEGSAENKPGESFDWLKDLTKTGDQIPGANINPFSSFEEKTDDNVSDDAASSDDDIPDWMKSAGWNTSSDDELTDIFGKSISEPTESDSLTSEDQASELSKTKPEFPSKLTNDDLTSLFTELKEGKMDKDDLTENGKEEKQFPPPDWMSQFSNSEEPAATGSGDQDFPDWLKNFQAEEPQVAQNSDNMPDWLRNLQSEVEPTAESSDQPSVGSVPEASEPEETTFDRIFSQTDSLTDAAAAEAIPQEFTKQDDGWENIELSTANSEEIGQTTQEPGPSSTASSDDRIPDWVKSVLLSQNPDEQTSISQESETRQNPVDDYLSSLSPDLQAVSQEENKAVVEAEDVASSQETSETIVETKEELAPPDTGEPSLETEEATVSQEAIKVVVEEEINPLETSGSTLEPEELITSQEISEPIVESQETAISQASGEKELEQQETPISQETSEPAAEREEAFIPQETIEAVAAPEEGIISQQTNDELLDWLRGLKTEDEANQKSEEASAPLEPFSEAVIEKEPELAPEELSLADILFPEEPVDQEPVTINTVASTNEPPATEITPELGMEQEQTVAPLAVDTEVADEFSNASVNAQPVEEIQTSELHPEHLVESLEETEIDEFAELINKSEFNTISSKISQFSAQDKGLDELVSTLNSISNQHENDFTYWQCLGDVHSKNNNLSDALLAYQKAEDILVKTISS